MLHEFIATHREELLRRCEEKVEARPGPPLPPAEIAYGLPAFFDQLIGSLRDRPESADEMARSAAERGRGQHLQGLTISQVVHGYGDVCQSITELAMEIRAPISVSEFRMLNGCLDHAIASAVTEYSRITDTPSARMVDEEQRIGFLAHEIRNLVNTATVAFEVLSTGDVGVGGSTGAVLRRSLASLRDLVTRSVAEVRLRRSVLNRVRIDVAELVAELAPAAELDAAARGLQLTVHDGEPGLAVHGDRQILAAILTNLLQNAFKFTAARTRVDLTIAGHGDRVSIEVADECGGLAEGKLQDLFRPFEQHNLDRTGLGLGLAFTRWAAEMHDGRILARSVAGHGCVFTIDLPRAGAAMHG